MQTEILNRVDELILLTWSFSVCIARVITDHRDWYVLSEVGGAIVCMDVPAGTPLPALSTHLTRLYTESVQLHCHCRKESYHPLVTKKPLSWAREFTVTSSV